MSTIFQRCTAVPVTSCRGRPEWGQESKFPHFFRILGAGQILLFGVALYPIRKATKWVIFGLQSGSALSHTPGGYHGAPQDSPREGEATSLQKAGESRGNEGTNGQNRERQG